MLGFDFWPLCPLTLRYLDKADLWFVKKIELTLRSLRNILKSISSYSQGLITRYGTQMIFILYLVINAWISLDLCVLHPGVGKVYQGLPWCWKKNYVWFVVNVRPWFDRRRPPKFDENYRCMEVVRGTFDAYTDCNEKNRRQNNLNHSIYEPNVSVSYLEFHSIVHLGEFAWRKNR